MDRSGRLFRTVVLVAMVAVVAALPIAVRQRFEGMLIPSTSMAPTLLPGDYVLVSNCAPADGRPPLAEPYADRSDEDRGAPDVGPVEVPSGAVFVTADNRNAGEDSRHWGPVSRSRIVGRPTWVYWSAGADGDARWDRVGLRLR